MYVNSIKKLTGKKSEKNLSLIYYVRIVNRNIVIIISIVRVLKKETNICVNSYSTINVIFKTSFFGYLPTLTDKMLK